MSSYQQTRMIETPQQRQLNNNKYNSNKNVSYSGSSIVENYLRSGRFPAGFTILNSIRNEPLNQRKYQPDEFMEL